ncbi:hypothetical protein J23TS9_12970 [Paenibacillus sp. J23TS9]|nr:hypothetical protein J23TS9_12970 [Paenibacillus sp. J23TS9]
MQSSNDILGKKGVVGTMIKVRTMTGAFRSNKEAVLMLKHSENIKISRLLFRPCL